MSAEVLPLHNHSISCRCVVMAQKQKFPSWVAWCAGVGRPSGNYLHSLDQLASSSDSSDSTYIVCEAKEVSVLARS